MGARTPDLTVGILTFQSARTLPHLLRSLQRNLGRLGASRCEVVFVDHSSSDETRQMLDEFLRVNPRVRVYENALNDLALSRQWIVDHARGEWLAFVDSDVVLPDDWFANALAFAAEGRVRNAALAGITGPIRLLPLAPELAGVELMQTTFIGHVGAEQMRPSDQTRLVTHLPTAASLFHREAILAVGGFDSRFNRCGEDLELGVRLARAGRTFVSRPELEVAHLFSIRSRWAWVMRAWRFGRARSAVAFVHPSLFLEGRFGLPVAFAVAEAAMAIWLGSLDLALAIAAVAAIFASDLGFCFISFFRRASSSRALNAAWLTALTHQAYAWGEVYGVLENVLAAHASQIRSTFANGRIFRRADRIKAVAVPRT